MLGNSISSQPSVDSFYQDFEEQPQVTDEGYAEIQREVSRVLPKKLVLVKQGLYKDYYQYIEEFCRRGGIIEASPSSISKEIQSVGILFQVDPDGEVEIQTTYDKILFAPFSPCGYKFPQKSLPSMNVRSIVEALAASLYKRGLFGFFGIDMIAFPDPFV